MPSDAAIRTQDLTKRFGRVRALEGVSLEVARGEIFGFLGANGAGKTTTIRLLLDLLRPTRGRAFLNGFDCQRDGLRARASVGYLPGEMPVYPDIQVRALLAFLAALQPSPPDPAWIDALQRRFDLTDPLLDRKFVYLSHGMKQKVGLVQALMGRAPVMVLDEPTAGLDPLMIEAFCQTMSELRAAGHTIFLSSHVLSEVERLCDRIALVAAGQLVKVASIEEIRREFPRRVRIAFRTAAAAPPVLDGVTVLDASDHEWRLEVRGELGALLARLDMAMVADIQAESFRLEDYILGLYEGRR
ncbi:MAG TPA: ABC transporter ATP-binding protein [Vicinamibacterales bacterium]|nr:ABC transporter ATP-binding protein [Vicinamibacterales bacterium]